MQLCDSFVVYILLEIFIVLTLQIRSDIACEWIFANLWYTEAVNDNELHKSETKVKLKRDPSRLVLGNEICIKGLKLTLDRQTARVDAS